MKRRISSFLGALIVVASTIRAAQITVPIYIEDNHAGSFYWLAEQLDLDEPCTLLHFDAHSDASALFDSDKIRTRLRRVASREQRHTMLQNWRRDGVVQCFNWIEPLLPAPIAEVIWIPRERVATEERMHLTDEATALLDGHLEAAPRAAGSFKTRYRVLDLGELERARPSNGPVVVTIDLDYFAGLAPNERSTQFERVWKFVSETRNLRAVTIAISRPYLTDDAEADALLQLALEAALSWPTAKIFFEPFQSVGNDQSLRARELQARHQAVPAFDLAKSSPALRAILLANQERIGVQEGFNAWNKTLSEWRAAGPAVHLAIRNHQPSTDHIWRIAATESAEIEVASEPWDASLGGVRWMVQIPEYERCNLTVTPGQEVNFARDAPPRPRWRDVGLPSSEKKLPLAAFAEFFDRGTECGALRIKVRVDGENWIRETPVLEVRRFRGTGFRAALSEQFGLPYLFGSGALRVGSDTGPETGIGADCANFLIHALRRQGARIPWSNPKQFRRYLEPTAEGIRLEDAPVFTADDLERGVVLHLGSHVAALMEDRPPLGVLNADDIVAHQLEGVPALLSVAELLQSRQVARFDLLRVPASATKRKLIIGGDVMLGRSVGEQIAVGVDPFAGIRAITRSAGNTVVNLECVVSDKGAPAPNKKFHLRAPALAAAALRDGGVKLVSLANNHAHDFGPEGLLDSIRQLRAAGLSVVGDDEVEHLVCGETRVAFLALDDSEAQALERAPLAERIARARKDTDFLIALVHWGEENDPIVTERQRGLARWLIDQGVDLIAGAHPHCLQPPDFYHGRPIAYSLGNLVFDGAPTLPNWNRGQLLQIGFGRGHKTPEVSVIPMTLDRQGFPHLLREPDPVALHAQSD